MGGAAATAEKEEEEEEEEESSVLAFFAEGSSSSESVGPGLFWDPISSDMLIARPGVASTIYNPLFSNLCYYKIANTIQLAFYRLKAYRDPKTISY